MVLQGGAYELGTPACAVCKDPWWDIPWETPWAGLIVESRHREGHRWSLVPTA